MKQLLPIFLILCFTCGSEQKHSEILNEQAEVQAEPMPNTKDDAAQNQDPLNAVIDMATADPIDFEENWGLNAKWENLDKDLCNFIKESYIKMVFKVGKVYDCKSRSTEANPDARMYLSKMKKHDKEYMISVLFSTYDKGFSKEMPELKFKDAGNKATEITLSNGQVPGFTRFNEIVLIVNKHIRMTLNVELIRTKPREEGGLFTEEIQKLAQMILDRLK